MATKKAAKKSAPKKAALKKKPSIKKEVAKKATPKKRGIKKALAASGKFRSVCVTEDNKILATFTTEAAAIKDAEQHEKDKPGHVTTVNKKA